VPAQEEEDQSDAARDAIRDSVDAATAAKVELITGRG
jgi:hypothetical protein